MTQTHDVERQGGISNQGIPRGTWKERIQEFFDLKAIKLYLYSFPLPDGVWDNRKFRLKASGVQVAKKQEMEQIVDRVVLIVQKQPAM